jgi:hypothetical protein
MSRSWLAWVGFFLLAMPFGVTVLHIGYVLNRIDLRDPDPSMSEATRQIGQMYDFQTFIGLPLQILGLGMLVLWFTLWLQRVTQPAQKGRGAQLLQRHGLGKIPRRISPGSR